LNTLKENAKNQLNETKVVDVNVDYDLCITFSYSYIYNGEIVT